MRDLPATLSNRVPKGSNAAAWVTRQVVKGTTKSVTGRVTRLIPGLGMGVSAWRSTRRQGSQGLHMKNVFRGAWEGDLVDLSTAVEAEEVRTSRS